MSSNPRNHTVVAGDTLASIAAQAGLTLAEVMAANLDIKNPDVIAVGQVILLPAKGGGDAPAVAVAETTIYTVRSGDSLAVIARRYEIDLPALLAANANISNPDRIRAGQTIIIPVKMPPPEPRNGNGGGNGDAQPQDGGGRTRAVGSEAAPAGEDPNAVLARCPRKGASERTARQDRLSFAGVRASRKMAENDARHVLPFMAKFNEAARRHGLPPALLAAIASRESRGGVILAKDGTGDNGHGFGLMQVDNRSGAPTVREGGPFGQPHINQATGILADKLRSVRKQFPNLSPEQQLVTAASRYNGGKGRPFPDNDLGTTGGDYGNDVVARAQFYAERWQGAVAPTLAAAAPAVHDAAKGFAPAPTLEEVQAGTAVLKVGHRGPAVRRVQELLGNVGTDEKFGDETHDAIVAFQAAHDMRPAAGSEGAVDKATLELLGTVHAARPARKGDVVYGRHVVSDKGVKDLLQKIADFTGSRVIITSGDRKRVVNSNSRSHHLVGRAADFKIEGLSLGEAYRMLKDAVIPKRDFQFIYHTEVTVAPHLHVGRYGDNRPSSFIVDTGQILKRRPGA
jgi:LysM repeat protein/peptidoglycan hydrolase-like protein with peptidoglycan-binding domain